MVSFSDFTNLHGEHAVVLVCDADVHDNREPVPPGAKLLICEALTRHWLASTSRGRLQFHLRSVKHESSQT